MSLVTTVEENKARFSERQVQRATKAYELYAKIGCPSVNEFKALVRNHLINNCPVTIEDILIAEKIYGPDVSGLKGKTTRRKPPRVETDYVALPPDILKNHGKVVLSADILFVQGYPFFVTISRNIKFNTVEDLNNMETNTLVSACRNICNVYTRRGFEVKTTLMDRQFAPVKEKFSSSNVEINLTSAKEHVPEIERFIRVMKERCRAMRSRFPYKRIPRRLVVAIVRHVSRWLNVFCPKTV